VKDRGVPINRSRGFSVAAQSVSAAAQSVSAAAQTFPAAISVQGRFL